MARPEVRTRELTVFYKLSKREDERFKHLIMLTGLTRQVFILEATRNKEVVAKPTPNVERGIQRVINILKEDLKLIESGEKELDKDFVELLSLVTKFMQQLKSE